MTEGRQPQHAHRRRSPLIIGAVAAFIFACGIVVFVVTQSNDRSRTQPSRAVEIAEPDNVAAAPAANGGHAVVDVSRTTRETHDAGAADVPAWARTPGIWTTPYPEGGRYNPPLPAVKLPPEMIGSAAPDASASADGQQFDVVDERALR
jgi:hypothetical protein